MRLYIKPFLFIDEECLHIYRAFPADISFPSNRLHTKYGVMSVHSFLNKRGQRMLHFTMPLRLEDYSSFGSICFMACKVARRVSVYLNVVKYDRIK